MPLKVLALGSPNALAYQSLSEALSKLGALEYQAEKKLRDGACLLDRFFAGGFSAIMMPNPYGNSHRLMLYQAMRAAGVPLLVFDRGALPRSWFFDVGFNADSPTYEADQWDHALSAEAQAVVDQYMDRVRRETPLEAQGPELERDALKTQLGVSGKRVLLVAFQRPFDTVVRHFAAEGFDGFCRLVNEVVERLPRDAPQWVVVAKKHPLETRRPQVMAPFAADDAHINSLLQVADAVLVINSGVGLLASLWNTPVMLTGQAFYSHPGLNRSVRGADEVIAHLQALPSPSVPTRDRLIYHLVHRVYSFGTFHTEVRAERSGALRNVTRHIAFERLRFPPIPQGERCLFVTSVLPVPIDRGAAQRTDQMLSALLLLGYRVHLLLLNQVDAAHSDEAIQARIRAHYGSASLSVEVVRHPHLEAAGGVRARYWLGQALRPWHAVTGGRARVNGPQSLPFRFARRLRRRLEGPYELVWFNYLRVMPSHLGRRPGRRVVVDLHDLQTQRVRNDVLPKLPRWSRSSYEQRHAQSERALMVQADLCLAISAVEAEEIRRRFCPAATVATVRATERPRQPGRGRATFDLLFIGSNSAANLDGLCWFLQDVWPRIRQRCAARLCVAGSIGRQRRLRRVLASADAQEAIAVVGRVEDLDALYGSARVSICPLRKGTGMKIKLVEALAYGMPLVATSVALEGIDGAHGLQARDSAEAFAQEVLRLLCEPDHLSAVASCARATFEAGHSPAYLHARLTELLASGAHGGAARAGLEARPQSNSDEV